VLFQQKIHWRAIFAQIGLLLHVPAAMATISLIICAIFGEWYALLPFVVVGVLGFGIGQLLYRCYYHEHEAHLWDAMIIAALSWLICSFLAAIPICWISIERLHAGVQSEVLKVLKRGDCPIIPMLLAVKRMDRLRSSIRAVMSKFT